MILSTEKNVGASFRRTLSLTLILAGVLLFAPSIVAAPVDMTAPDDLAELSIEDLLSVEVTSVSKRSEQLRNAASAVYVITREDIRRSGVTSIAEALRMAPGLEVAHIDANKWAISSRGFNDRWANKLLVLVDGRSIYTPTFSGVWWDAQDYLLEDIDRIEVIRGPGATLWGANAVNGVINIITRNSSETEGIMLGSMFGNEERTPGQFRFGGRIGTGGAYRVYGKRIDRDNSVFSSGSEATDAWDQSRGGFRADFELGRNSELTVQGDTFDGAGSENRTLPSLTAPYSTTSVADIDVSGHNLLARWRKSQKDSETVIQAYYDMTNRTQGLYHEKRHALDLEYHRRFVGSRNHTLTWGAGYRRTRDDTSSGTMQTGLVPDSRGDSLTNAFIQDDVTLREAPLLRLTIGTKLEHNDYTGTEIQPGARLLWTPDKKRTGWAAISRAIRSPSRADTGVRIPYETRPPVPPFLPFPQLLVVTGNPDFKSEVLWAYEIGYRVAPSRRLSLDAAAFYNDYDRLRTYGLTGTPYLDMLPAPHIVVPVEVGNFMNGRSYGFELATNWKVSPNWRLASGYTFLRVDLSEDAITGTDAAELFAGYNPRHQFHLRSYLDLPGNLEFDTMLYVVDKLPNFDIPAYARLDLRLGWRPKGDYSVCVGVQNLLDDHHPEFGKTMTENATEVERTLYALVTWRR